MKKTYLLKISLLLIVVFWLSSTIWGSDKTTFFAADSPKYQYMGQVAINEGEATSCWPSVTVAVDFSGKLLGIPLKGGECNYFNVWVDDYPVHAVNNTVWWFPEHLSRGQHQLRLVKRTNADMGTAVFYGLYLGEIENLIQPAALPERKLLFIRNSLTCAYGTEGEISCITGSMIDEPAFT